MRRSLQDCLIDPHRDAVVNCELHRFKCFRVESFCERLKTRRLKRCPLSWFGTPLFISASRLHEKQLRHELTRDSYLLQEAILLEILHPYDVLNLPDQRLFLVSFLTPQFLDETSNNTLLLCLTHCA